MTKNKLVFVLILFWITSGCQQTWHSTPSLSTRHTQYSQPSGNTADLWTSQIPQQITDAEQNSAQSAISYSEDNTDTQGIAKGYSVDTEPVSKPDSTTGNTPSEGNEAPLVSNPQAKIDQALELCSFAQQMWEKGKIEAALNNLDSAYFSILELESDIEPEVSQQKEDIRYLISKRILEIYASRQIVVSGQHNEIPIPINKYVQREIKNLTGPERTFFIQSLERSHRYRPFIVSELKKAGFPESLSWLPLIESGFKIRAFSPARALGLWQFIPSTGYKFGLNRNYYIDERLDHKKSTKAAIAYLKELHTLFGDWTTALAAYNCGESRVLKIIRKQRINYLDNFWDLYQNLPKETSRYISRFLATLHIIKNPEKYNIKIKKPLRPIDYKVCEIKKQVRLKDIASEIGVSFGLLKELNAELRYAILPPETYQLKVPAEKAALFVSKIDKIKSTYSPPLMYVFHRVRKGQTLSGIAKKYKTSIGAIARANNIGRSNRIYAGKVLKIPGRNSKITTYKTAAKKRHPDQKITYKVRQGDNLWEIARKFGTTTKHIMAINRLPNTRLNIGQKLKITSEKNSQVIAKTASTYKVRQGDNPFFIAKKHNMSLNRLLALNQLSKRSKIFPGQTLIVE